MLLNIEAVNSLNLSYTVNYTVRSFTWAYKWQGLIISKGAYNQNNKIVSKGAIVAHVDPNWFSIDWQLSYKTS